MGILTIIFELHYFLCCFTNPGHISKLWSDLHLFELKFSSESEKLKFQFLNPNIALKNEKYAYCFHCKQTKPERAHHCSACNQCYLKMDHHCPWMGNCIGFYNHKFFINTLGYGALLSIMICIMWFFRIVDIFKNTVNDNSTNYSYGTIRLMFSFTSLALSFVFGLATLIMFLQQITMGMYNLTTIEAHKYTFEVFLYVI